MIINRMSLKLDYFVELYYFKHLDVPENICLENDTRKLLLIEIIIEVDTYY